MIDKKTAIHREKQNIKFAKEEFKLALRNIKFSITDYVVAKISILKIRFRRKSK